MKRHAYQSAGSFLTLMLACLLGGALLSGCSSLLSQAAGGLTTNLGTAILNQDDPETVRDGAPAYLLMLDSFVEGAPDDPGVLSTAADLYAAYGVLFVEDPERASRLTRRALSYGQRALCAADETTCGMHDLPYREYTAVLEQLDPKDVPTLYTYALSWFGYIRVHSSDMAAFAKLPRAEAALRRVHELDAAFREAEVEHYLGVLATLRPPALGGDFQAGRAHFEQAILLSNGRNLATKVDFAQFYGRGLYDRELHDRLLNEVLAADPEVSGLTLFNVLAQRKAVEMLASANDYF